MKKFLCLLLPLILLCSCAPQMSDAPAQTPTPVPDELTPTEAPDTEANDIWSVGFAYEEIVPDDYNAETDSYASTYYVAGYNNDHHATGMLDPQCVRAVYIADKNGNSSVIAAIDCVGISRKDISNIRKRISDLVLSMNISNVHIISTHTHAGIDTLGLWGPVGIDGKNDGFMEKVYTQAEKAIRNACASICKGKLLYGKADTGDMQYDSRLPRVYDTFIHRIRFEPIGEGNGLQLITYAAHAESLRGDNRKVSADYPCYMGRKIKAETGDDFIYFPAAIGGLVMTERQKDVSGREYPVEENVVITGEKLADCVLSIKDEITLTSALSDKTVVYKVNLDNQAFATFAFLGVLSTDAVDGESGIGLALETQASLIKMGELSIALVPGELFPELAYGEYATDIAANPTAENPTPLKEIIGNENFLVWGLADDEIGYIVSPNDFYLHPENPFFERGYENDRRHYEETNSVGIDSAYKLAEAFKELVK